VPIENCLTEGVQSEDLCTTCVQEGGFEGPEIGPKQRRLNNRLLGYRSAVEIKSPSPRYSSFSHNRAGEETHRYGVEQYHPI